MLPWIETKAELAATMSPLTLCLHSGPALPFGFRCRCHSVFGVE